MRWLLILMLMVMPALAEATTYYVSTSGSDSNSCATAQSGGASAKRNPGDPSGAPAGGVNCLSAGDTLIIQDGNYTNIGSFFNNIPPGTSESVRTTIKCENARQCTLHPDSLGFYLRDNDDYITLQDMVIDGDFSIAQPVTFNPTTGVAADFPSHVKFHNNEVKEVTNWLVYDGNGEFNEFTDNYLHDSTGVNAGGIYGLGRNSIYRGNVMHNVNIGISLHSSGGLTPSGNLVERNHIHTCNVSGGNLNAGFNLSGTTTNTIRRNVVRNCVHGIRTSAGLSTNATIDHNVLYNNSSTGISLLQGSGNVVRNNIALSNGTNITITGGVGTQTDNRTTGTATDLFIDPVNGDFRLKAGSAAIDDGTDISLAYNGSAPDHGAFETVVFASCVVEDGDASTIRVTFTNNVQPPLLPATGVTGFTSRKATVANAVTAAVRNGDNQVYLTVTNAIAQSEAVDITYSAGNLTDSSLVGNTYNQPYVGTLTQQSCTNNVTGGGGSPDVSVLTQSAAAFHFIRGAEDAPTVLAVGPSGRTIQPGGMVRIRFTISCTDDDCPATGLVLQASRNGGAYAAVPDSPGSDKISFIGTSPLTGVPANGTVTTGGDVPCLLIRTANAVPTLTLLEDQTSQCEYAVRVATDATVGDTYDFRLYKEDGNALDAHTVTPRLVVIGKRVMGFN